MRAPPHDFFSLSSALLCVLNAEGVIIQVNPAWEEKLNVVDTDLVHSRYLHWVHPEDIEHSRQQLKQLSLFRQQSINFANRWRDCAGHYHWLNWEITAIPKRQQFYAVATDITAQKQAEKNLHHLEQRFELAIQAAHHGVWDWDLRTHEVYFSPYWKNILGYEDDALENHLDILSQLLHPEDFIALWACVEAYLDQRLPECKGVYRVRHQQGHYRWILVQAAALWDQYQQPQRLVSTWIDITQRRQIEQALQASEALLSAIFEVTQIGLCITDEQGRFVRVNPAYCRLFNYTAEELVGAHFTKVLPPDHHERALKLHHAFLSGDPKVDTEGEWRIVNRAGECMDISFTMGLLTQSNGQRFRVTTITDITKRKRLELERNRLFNLSVDMQAIIGFELDFKEVNAAWKHVLGWSKTELLEHSPMDFVHPDDQVAAFEALQQLQQGETIFNFEVRYLCQDKYYKWLSWNIYPLVDQQTLYAVIRDVTEHKRAEEEIQRQQVFIRLVVDSVPHLIFIKDHQGHFIFFNRSLTDLLGLQPPAVAELTDSPSMMTERCSKAEIQVLEQKEEVTLEESCCTPEGEARWFYMIKKPFVQDNSEIAVLSVGTDITQRKQHEEALRQSESRYRAIVQDQIDLVCRFLPNGNLTFVNYAFCRYFDRPEPELVGQNFLNFLPAHEQRSFQQQLQQLTTAAPVMTYEHRLQLSGKQQIHWQHWFIRVMFNSDDRITEYQAVGRDITERKQAEEALRQSEERLRFVTSAAPVILFALDTEGFFTFARGKALSLLNLTNDEVVGSSVFDIFAQFPQELTYIRRTLAGETVTTLMNFPNVVLEMKLTPLLNEAQQVEGVIGISVDMTTRHALEVQLKETVAELETILDNSVIGIAYVKNGVFIWVNSKLEDLLAFKPQELYGIPFSIIFPSYQDYQRIERQAYTLFEQGQWYDEGQLVRTQSGHVFWCRLMAKAVAANDLAQGIIWLIEDITTQKQAEQNLRLTATVFETTADGIFVTDLNKKILRVNPAFCKITGYSAEEVYGKKTTCLSSGRHDEHFYQQMWQSIETTGHWQGEIWNRKKTGEVYVAWLSISAITDEHNQATQYMAVLTDISCLQEDIENVRYLANYDSLTQLPNRSLFHDNLLRAQAWAKRHHNAFALLFIDLDGFKPVNDTLGHAVGDQLLQAVAQRLQDCVRETDTVARLGGDEFTVILKNIRKKQDAVRVVEIIVRTLQQPFKINGHAVTISASIGIAVYPYDDTDVDKLLTYADAAMYEAKEAGKGVFKFYRGKP